MSFGKTRTWQSYNPFPDEKGTESKPTSLPNGITLMLHVLIG